MKPIQKCKKHPDRLQVPGANESSCKKTPTGWFLKTGSKNSLESKLLKIFFFLLILLQFQVKMTIKLW